MQNNYSFFFDDAWIQIDLCYLHCVLYFEGYLVMPQVKEISINYVLAEVNFSGKSSKRRTAHGLSEDTCIFYLSCKTSYIEIVIITQKQ